MKPGRRAFFLPRLLATTPWANFCLRLARAVRGRFDDLTVPAGPGRGVLAVARDEDVFHARALCAEYGVLLVLPGAQTAGLPAERAWLSLTLEARDEVELFDIRRGTLTLQPGVTLGAVRSQILDSGWVWPHGGADDVRIVDWVAQADAWAPGRCADSGLVWADVMLAGGDYERLGPFGVNATRPLRSSASSRLVSSLFELTGTLDMHAMLSAAAWPARFYRLDAMTPRAASATGDARAADPNPAHLLLGSAGSLAWIGTLHWQLVPATAPTHAVATASFDAPHDASSPSTTPVGPPGYALELANDQIKGLFDPMGLFPGPVV